MMQSFKHKTGLFLACVVITACFMFVCAVKSVQAADEKTNIFSSAYLNDPNQVLSRTTDADLSTSFRRMIGAVLIFALLGAAAIYASKKILPKYTNTVGKRIKVIETVRLDARKTVYLLQVGSQQILIGGTPDRMTKLADIFEEKEFPQIQTEEGEETK